MPIIRVCLLYAYPARGRSWMSQGRCNNGAEFGEAAPHVRIHQVRGTDL